MSRGWVEKHGSVYRYRYRHNGRTYTKSGYKTKGHAQAQLNVVLGQLVTGDWIDPRGGDVLTGEWLDYWLPTASMVDATKAKIASHVRHHVKPYWGERKISSIKPSDVRRWIAELTKSGLAPESIRSIFHVFGKAMRDAVSEGLVRRNPAKDIELPKIVRIESAFLDEYETLALYQAVLNADEPKRRGRDPRIVVRSFRAQAASDALLILTAGYTGMRWGELTGLSAARITHGVISVRDVLVEVGGKLSIRPYPKSGGSVRDIPLPAFLVEMLNEHLRSHHHPLVFTDSEGKPLRRSNFARRVLAPATKQLGVEAHFHSLRHSHRAFLIEDGVPEFVSDVRMGHAPKGMAGRYSHVLPGANEVLVKRLQLRWERSLKRSARTASAAPLKTNAPTVLPNASQEPEPLSASGS